MDYSLFVGGDIRNTNCFSVLFRKFIHTSFNSPFHSCVLGDQAFEWKRARVDLVKKIYTEVRISRSVYFFLTLLPPPPVRTGPGNTRFFLGGGGGGGGHLPQTSARSKQYLPVILVRLAFSRQNFHESWCRKLLAI